MGWFDSRLFGEVFVTLIVIMDPLGSVPLFLGLSAGRTVKARRRLAWQAVVVAAGVIAVFAVFGRQILDYLGITVPALQGSGGLLLLLVALQLLTGQTSPHEEADNDVNIALVPLGTPLLAGPGAIVATIVFVQRAHGARDVLAIAAGLIAVHVVLWLALRFSISIVHVVRESGISLLTRVFGLLLSAIAVQLIADSVTAFIHQGHG